MPEANSDIVLYCIFGITAFVILVLMVIRLAAFLNDFSHELQFIDREIKRTTGKERQYWLRAKRRLWLSLIPFVKY